MLYPLTKMVTNASQPDVKILKEINQFIFGNNNLSIVLIESCLILFLASIFNYANVVGTRAFSLIANARL